MRSVVLGIGVACFCLVQAKPLTGQVSMEFGVDAAYERVSVSGSAGGTLSLFAVPMQSVRVGFYVQDAVSLEPRLGITRVSADGGSSETQLRASLAGLYFLGEAGQGDSRVFLSVVSGLDYGKIAVGEADASTVQLRVGTGAGILLPIQDRLFLRTSLEYHRSFESRKALAANHLVIAVGFSFTFS